MSLDFTVIFYYVVLDYERRDNCNGFTMLILVYLSEDTFYKRKNTLSVSSFG